MITSRKHLFVSVALILTLMLAHNLPCRSTSIEMSIPSNNSTGNSSSSTTTASPLNPTNSSTSASPQLPASSAQPQSTTTLQTSAAAQTTTAAPAIIISQSTQSNQPSSTFAEKDIELIKKSIQEHIEPNHNENRLLVNRPTQVPQMSDFAPDSMESLVADATTQFGLKFINNLPKDNHENVVFSPLSLQNLFNMILLGATDNSTTEHELSKVLGYDATHLLQDGGDRFKPHAAMRSVFQNILAATHLSVNSGTAGSDHEQLLNANIGSLNSTLQTPSNSSTSTPNSNKQKQVVTAHLQTSFKESDTPLSGQMNFTLANLVLTNRDQIELKPEYEKNLKTYYNVNVEKFSRETTKRSDNSTSQNSTIKGSSLGPLHERVNKWVKSMTQGQIDRLANEDDLSGEDLIMVLLNAAHFKGRWLHTFNSKATYDRTFYNGGNRDHGKTVKFMRQKSVFGYADFGTAALQAEALAGANQGADSRTRASEDAETLLTEDINKQTVEAASPPIIELSKEEARRMELTAKLNCSVLMLPFSLNEGQELSMILLLPAKQDGIAELQAALDGPALNEIYKSLSEQQVQVELPKFSFEDSHDAKATLLRMGLRSIFQESANLDRMYNLVAKKNGLSAKVDKVIHKAKISVDESGAEAAAASMASIVLRNFIRPPTPVFVADHPFLFVIRHNRSNMPLFMGRVSGL